MAVSTDNKLNPQRKQAMQTLLGFLLGLLELQAETAKSLDRLTRLDLADDLDNLSDIGAYIGLRMDRVALTPSAAAEASATQTPLVARLSDGRGWLVVYGFRAGRVRVALVQGEVIEERRIKPAAVRELLGLPEGRLGDWLLVQAKAPLSGAVSHDHHAHLPPLRRLIELMRADHADLWLVLGLALGSGLLALASPIAVQALVNTVAMSGMGQPLLVLSTILFFFLTFAGAVHVLQSYLVEIVQRRIFVRLAADLAYRLPRVRSDAYEHHHGPELVNRFFDVLTVQKAGSSLLLDGLSTAVQTLVGLIMLAFYHPFLLAFDVVLVLSIFFIIFVLGRGGVATAIQESLSKYALVAWLEIVAGNMQTFKFNGGPELAAQRTDALALAYLDAKRTHYQILLRQIVGSVTLYAIAQTALLAIGGYLVIDGHLTLGQLVAAELIVSAALISLVKFGKHLEGYYDLMAGADKIGHLLDLPLEREQGVAPVMTGPVSLAVRGLSFGFGAKQPVFSNFTMQVQPGERIAVFGGFGSGKSTLAALLCGLRQPGKGHIEINGVDLGNLRLEALRNRIAVVGRAEFFQDSLLENVRLGRPELRQDEVEQALDAVGLLDDIAGLSEDGLDTDISPSGAPLSTAQGRLLLLARAIAGRPALLILDGILDEMDEAARRRLAPALFANDAPWTLLVLTASPNVAALCGRTVELPGVDAHA
ncbi:MAG: ABC transporter ATP-binding protein [Methylobacter sp.]|uniref:ABC transporter ATP-binding protein n=1 Tax=Candidatus Methylobacter titanis TaxID=3053457 RepID=A0AA43Q2F4_9GAMM|nr:ABC transporter ATP-binding protein [Candidatus Methylobacter titanis]